MGIHGVIKAGRQTLGPGVALADVADTVQLRPSGNRTECTGRLLKELRECVAAKEAQVIALKMINPHVENISVENVIGGGREIGVCRCGAANIGQRQKTEELDRRL